MFSGSTKRKLSYPASTYMCKAVNENADSKTESVAIFSWKISEI